MPQMKSEVELYQHLVGEAVTYRNKGCPSRLGWKGTIVSFSREHTRNTVKIKWSEHHEPTTYHILSLIGDGAYLILDKETVMSYVNDPSVKGKKFFMVVNTSGQVQSGMITEAAAEEIAEELAAVSKTKSAFFVVATSGKFYAKRPQVNKVEF